MFRWRTLLLAIYAVTVSVSSFLVLDSLEETPRFPGSGDLLVPVLGLARRVVPVRAEGYALQLLDSPLGTVLAVFTLTTAVLLAGWLALSLAGRRARRG